MFEQSMLLDFAPAKKAGALAVSLTVQTLAVGTLLLIPLLYTDQLPFAQLQLPTFLPMAPPPDRRKPQPAHPAQIPVARGGRIFVPRTVPPLDTRPEIVFDAPAPELTARPPEIGPALSSLLGLPRALSPPPPVVAVE